MSRFKIYSKDGLSVRYEGTPVYNGTYLKPSYLEFRDISSPTPIEWEIGDYVLYERTGLTYRLYTIPQPKKQARSGAYGASFVYSGVQLYADTKQLEIAPFRDLVLNDNQVHFSTQQNVATYENVEGVARRIQACMDDLYPDKWTIKVEENLDEDVEELIEEARSFSVSGGSCLDALDQIYSVWEDIGWVHSYDATTGKNIITIASSNTRRNANTTPSFAYGKGNGLISLRKTQANADEMATRLYVYGSSKNMVSRYYNGKDIVDADSVDIQNLMLPISKWGKTSVSGVLKPDAKKAYLQSSSDVVSKLGLLPKSVYFDGSDQEEIYPTLQKVTIGEIKAVKTSIGDTSWVPSSVYSDSDRVDEVKAVVNPMDGGSSGSGGVAFVESHKISVPGTAVTCGPGSNVESGVWSFPFSDIGLATKVISYNEGQKQIVVTPSCTGVLRSSGGTVYEVSASMKVVVSGGNNKVERTMTANVEKVDGVWTVTLPEVMVQAPSACTKVEITVNGYVRQSLGSPSPVIYFNSGSISLGVKAKLSSSFVLYLRQIGFNINEMVSLASQGKCTVSFKDGMNAGRSFAVKTASYRASTDDWELVMYRAEDTSLDMSFPNSNYPVNVGDHFVLLDIAMPELYIQIAESRLLSAGQKLLEDVSRVKPFYEPEIDAKLMTESETVIREGMFMRVDDEDIIEDNTDYVIIDTLTISEDDSAIPTYKVTLREQKKVSFQQSTSAEISSINQKISSVSENKGTAQEGTTNYEDLNNLPAIGGVVLMGTKSPYEDIGLVTKDMFEFVDVTVNGETTKAIKTSYPFYSESQVSAFGMGSEAPPQEYGVGRADTWNEAEEDDELALGVVLGLELKEDQDDMKEELRDKANLASPTFTGTPTAPTATSGTNDSTVANAEFVQQEIDRRILSTTLTVASGSIVITQVETLTSIL